MCRFFDHAPASIAGITAAASIEQGQRSVDGGAPRVADSDASSAAVRAERYDRVSDRREMPDHSAREGDVGR
jgi:hypothetical protein